MLSFNSLLERQRLPPFIMCSTSGILGEFGMRSRSCSDDVAGIIWKFPRRCMISLAAIDRGRHHGKWHESRAKGNHDHPTFPPASTGVRAPSLKPSRYRMLAIPVNRKART